MRSYFAHQNFVLEGSQKQKREAKSTKGLRPKLRRDWEHENESKNGIFKEISGGVGYRITVGNACTIRSMSLG